MSNRQMMKYNIKSIKETNAGLLICSTDSDEWLLKEDNTLLHRSNRNKRGNIAFHYQCKVKGLYHCMAYIKSHTYKLTQPKRKLDRMSYLFSLIWGGHNEEI